MNRRELMNRSIALAAGSLMGRQAAGFGQAQPALEGSRSWTVYLAQDKHLDYNWCGSTTEIELRMAEVLDFYCAEDAPPTRRWNLDCTLWDEVYGRHRGPEGQRRLRQAIREGRIGYAGTYGVLLWGILSTESAVRACLGSIEIERDTGVPARTALVMENAGMTWGAASALTACGFSFLGRGIYPLRAETYYHDRDTYPLFWWQAPDGRRLLVNWDAYVDTTRWGGYAEAFALLGAAGIKFPPDRVQIPGINRDDDVFNRRVQYIEQTVARHEAQGPAYPVNSVLLLGTGHDAWLATDDLSAFVARFNAEYDGPIQLLDARYQDFFEAVERELAAKRIELPTLAGTYGVCWEEWAAHLAGPTAGFREAERLMRQAEAICAAQRMSEQADSGSWELVHQAGIDLLKFAEHDFGGTNRRNAALSAAARTAAVTQALDAARSVVPPATVRADWLAASGPLESLDFAWHGGRVRFDPDRCAVIAIENTPFTALGSITRGPALGELVRTRYQSFPDKSSLFPPPRDEAVEPPRDVQAICRRGDAGAAVIEASYRRFGFEIRSRWLFHGSVPWIDVEYDLRDGWTEEPQSVEVFFPLALDAPGYLYDTAGAILRAGRTSAGGDDLPGANPELYAAATFAAATGGGRSAYLISPDCLLCRFGPDVSATISLGASSAPGMIASMPMMNLTRNDRQYGQGGQRAWRFRYRLVLDEAAFDPVRAIDLTQRFGSPPYLQTPACPPDLEAVKALSIQFAAGPVVALKPAVRGRGVILRLWNVTQSAARGSLRLPAGWTSASLCDALERPLEPLAAQESQVLFQAPARALVTLHLEP